MIGVLLFRDVLLCYSGMGGMFGDHYLRDRMDRAMELSIVDKVLWDHFLEFVKDADNTKQAIAFGLMTLFRQIGFVNSQNSVIMENCPSFVCKDKKALKNRLKKVENVEIFMIFVRIGSLFLD